MARARRRFKARPPSGYSALGDGESQDTTLGVAPAENDPATEALVELIKSQPIDDWGIFTTGKPFTAAAKKQDSTYRTVPLEGTEEFMFAGLHVGKRGKMIFEFRPIDPTYALYEFDETKVFEAVPELEGRLSEVIGSPKGEVDYDKPGDAYSAAVSQFKAKFRRAVVDKVKIEAAEKVKENEDRMAENPLFGMF